MKINNSSVDNSKQHARINWAKIAGKAGNGARALFEPVMPATFNTIGSTTNIMRDIRNATRVNKSIDRRNESARHNSAENRRSMNLFKSALDDIQSGTFGMDRINDEMYDDYENDTASSFNMPSGDEAVDMSTEEILLLGNKGVAQSIIQSSSAQLRGLEASSKALIKSNIKSTQAMAASINNTLVFGFGSINTTLNVQNQKLDNINRNLQGILEFNNRNAIEYYSKSLDMLSGLGKMMENLDKSMNPDMRKHDRRYDASGGFNIRSYVDYVKEGFKESLFGNSVDIAKSSRGSVKDFGIMGILADFLIPKTLTKPLEKFDKSLTRFFDEGFKRLGEKLNENPLLAMFGLGDIFGSKRESVKSLNLGNYMKNATPWNGVAQKALTEVIPELLTSIDSKLDNSEKRYYDYEKGQFRSRSSIEKSMHDEYFDTFSMSLKDSMDKLTEVVKATGKGKVDQESLISAIQGIIDDQVSGKSDVVSARRDMRKVLEGGGVDTTKINDFIMEFQDGLEGAISRINDLYHEIGSTQHIYRNINNSEGNKYSDRLKRSHSDNRGKHNYRSFSFTEGISSEDYVDKMRRKAGISDTTIMDDRDFIDMVLSMRSAGYSDNDIVKEIKRYSTKASYSSKATSWVGKKFAGAKRFVDSTGGRMDNIVDDIVDRVANVIYMGDSPFPKKRGSSKNLPAVAPATTRMSQKGGALDSKESKATEQITALATRDYNKYIEQGQSQNDKDQRIMENAIDIFQKSPAATTIEDSIIKSNNIVFATLSTMLASFKGFTSRLFGKEGFFAKFWQSDARKKATAKLKEKLFTGENAIFKDQYEGAKAGLKNLKDKTIGYLGDGYDFLYDNTMQYMYGEDYQNEDSWKNNKFVSQTLNRKWRAEQKKAKEQAQVDNLTNENLVAETTENTTSELLGLPERATSVDKAILKKRKIELAKKLNILESDRSKDSSEERKQYTDELTSINEMLRTPIEKTSTALMEIGDKMVEQTKAVAETAVGDLDESVDSKKKSYKDSFFKKLKDTAPKALAAGIAGAGIGLLNSKFSLLGSMFLPGGPVSGAIVGSGLAILSQTEAFKTFMFGKMDPNTQKREGGLISNKMQGTFKKMLPFAIGGAVIGGLKGLAKSALGFNGGLGVLGMQILPGGIIGGAMLGAGLGILKNSEGFNKMLFGEKGEDGKRHGKFLSDSFNKVKGGFSKFLPKLGKAGAGLGIGALTGAVLQNAGYIPAMFSMGGPVGMGVVGLGLGIASSTKKFNEWMFGSEELDENGNPTGKKRKDGMLTRVQNMLMVNVVEPISDAFKTKMLDLVDWTKDKITYPFRLAFGPILDSLIGIKDNIVDFAKDKFEAIGNGIMDVFRNTIKTMFSPITKAIGFVGKSMIGIASTGAKAAMALPSVGLQTLRVLTAGKRAGEYKEFYKKYYAKGNLSGKLREKWQLEEEAGNKRNIFSKISDTIGTYIGHGDIADAARQGWNDEHAEDGENHLKWRNVGQEKRAMHAARKERLQNEKQWRKIDKARTRIVNRLGGREVTLTDYQFEKYRDEFKKLGISDDKLQSSDDIMDLLYRRNDFKKRLDPTGKGGGLMMIESPEQKAAREKTEQYQDAMMDFLDGISDDFAELARELLADKHIIDEEKEWRKDKKNLKRRLRSAGFKNINVDDPELRDFDINEVDKEKIQIDYATSEYAEKGDFLGFLKAFGITQKSKYKSGDKDSPKVGEDSAKDILKDMNENIKDLHATTERNKEINAERAAIESSMDEDDIDDKDGRDITTNKAKKLNPINRLFSFFKKKEKEDAYAEKEASEKTGPAHSALTIFDGKSDASDSSEETEEKSGFAKVWDKIKSVGKFIGGTTIWKLLTKAVGFAGSIGIPIVLGATIAELIRPGSAQKMGDSIDSFNQSVLDGEITWESMMTGLKNKINQFGDKLLTGAKDIFGEEKVNTVIEWYKEHVAPKVDVVKTFILDTIPEWAKATGNFIEKNSDKVITALSAVIEHLAPPLITAFVQVVPTIAAAIVKGILGGLGNLGEKALEKLGWIKPKSKTVSKSEAESDLKISGTRSRKNEMTKKKEIGEAQAMSKLNSNSEDIRNTVIQNAATGQYYIYADEEQTQTRKYLDDESYAALMEDPEMASTIWYDPNVGAYFVEEATFEQYADNVYITSDGKVKTQGNTDAIPALAKVGTRMATRGAQGLSILSKSDKRVLKGALWAGKKLGKMSLGVFNLFGKAGKAVGGMIKTGFNAGAKLLNFGKKAVTKKAAAEVIVESAERQMPKLLEKILKAFKGIKDNKAVRAVFDKFKKSLTTSIDDILIKFVKYLNDIALRNFGKVSGEIAERVAAKASVMVGKSVVTSIPIITIVSAAWGLVDGALSAANLFEVSEDDVDWKMRLISSLMECLLSISVGCWIDLLFLVVELVSGLDLKHEIAMFLYKLLSGFDADAIEKVTNSQENLSMEAEVYNAINNTNMDTKSYNDKRNKTIWGKMWSGVSSIWKDKQTEYSESGQKYSDYTKVLTKAGYTSDDISKMTTKQVKKAVNDNIDNGALTGKSYNLAKESLGMGKGTASLGYGMYAQGDPRWGKMPIGMLPDGSVATMDKAGCGPTAMAAVANTVAQRSMGYGPVTPADMGAYAASNGYISQGGANTGLFTEGAERMGLNSSPITNSNELRQNLLAGKPAVLTGKSASLSDPYTSAGHIVMADGLYGNQMSVMDPITGKHKLYDINKVSKNTEHAWGYSAAGYGPNNQVYWEMRGEKVPIDNIGKIPLAARSNAIIIVDNKRMTYEEAVDYLTPKKPIPWPNLPTFGTLAQLQKNMEIVKSIDPDKLPENVTMQDLAKATLTNDTKTLKTFTQSYKKTISFTGTKGHLIDNSTHVGYNTDLDTGIDTILMDANYKSFISTDTYYTDKLSKDMTNCNKVFEAATRNKTKLKRTKLHYILSTQYFGISGGTFGSIKILPHLTETGAYKIPDLNTSFTKDIVANIFAAAIIQEHKKGNRTINAPLSFAEKYLAICNALRVMYGFENAVKFTSTGYNIYGAINKVTDADYEKLAALMNVSDISDDVEQITDLSNGITNADQLREIAKNKKTFGKIRLTGLILRAKINSILNGTEFWQEFATLTREDANNSARNTPLTGASTSLKRAITSPRHIQEELLGKTIENAYIGETGGDYSKVINDTNKVPSIGPLQVQKEYAKNLLKKLQAADGLPDESRKIFSKYAHDDILNRALTAEEINELSGALGDSANGDIIKSIIDDYSMRYYHTRFYQPHLAGYYDNKVIKDLRTLPMLADIGNTGPAHIWDTTGDHAHDSFMTHWTPVAKEKDFESAYNLLNSDKTYWKNSKYSGSYMGRIKNTYDRLKDYTFRKSVEPGELGSYFATETNPLGYGPLSVFSKVGEALTDKVEKNTKVKTFTSSMGKIANALVGGIVRGTGASASDFGLSLGENSDGGQQQGNSGASDGAANTDPIISALGPIPDSSKNATAYFTSSLSARKSSDYGMRFHPKTGKYKMHSGIDYGTGGKSPAIYTPVSGTCVDNRVAGGYGNWCVIEAADGTKHCFAHMKSKSPLVVGQSYPAGTLVGYVGSTGVSTGPHLHYEIRTANGGTMDPEDYRYPEILNGNDKSFQANSGSEGYGNIKYTKLQPIGYGNPNIKYSKIDSPAYREQLRKSLNNQEDFRVTPKDFEAIGFGPGMSVDAGFDMTNTDDKLEKIFSVIAEWFAESKKAGAAQSSATTNVNMINSRTTNVAQSPSTSRKPASVENNKDKLVNHHLLISAKQNVRNTL